MKAPPVVYLWRCPVCHKPEKLVLACVNESSGQQTVAIPTCACDRSRVRVQPEWRTAEPHTALIDAVRHVVLGESILLEGSQEPCDTLEALFEAWGDLTQPRAFQRNGTGEAAAAPEPAAPSSGVDPITDTAAEESTANVSRRSVFDAEQEDGQNEEASPTIEGSGSTPAEYARTLDQWGLHVLPLCPKGKKPLGREWQKRPREENLRLLAANPTAGVGFIPGLTVDPVTKQPVPLMHVDVDGPDAWRWFKKQVPTEVRNATVAWRSARGGHGFLFRLPSGSPLAKTTKTMVWQQDHSSDSERKTEAVELRVQRSQGVLPPTTVTIEGSDRPYTWLEGAKQFEDFAGPEAIPILPEVLLKKAVQQTAGERKDPKDKPTAPAEELGPEYLDALKTVAECVAVLPPESVEGYTDAINLGMAIHSVLPDQQGFQLWDTLCKKTLDRYNEDTTWTATKWKSLHQQGNAEGQITLGTLVARATPYLRPRAEEEFMVHDNQAGGEGEGDGSKPTQEPKPTQLSGSRGIVLDEGPVADLLRSIGFDQLANPDRQHEVLHAFAEGFHRLPLQVQPAAEAAMLGLLRRHIPVVHAEKLLRYAIAPSAVEPPYAITSEGQAVYHPLDVRNYDLDAQYVIDNVLPARSVAMISADMSMGKSWLALTMALSVAFGKPFFGRTVRTACPVVYFATEGAYPLMLRCAGWLIGHKLLEPQHTLADLHAVLDGKLHVVANPLPFDHPQFEATWRGTVKQTGAGLVFCDTLGKMLGCEQNENDSNAANGVTGMLSRLCHETDVTALLLHHTGYGNTGRARGSSGWEQGCDLTFVVTGTRDDLKDGRTLTLMERKPWRGGAFDLRLPFKLTSVEAYLLGPGVEPINKLDETNVCQVLDNPSIQVYRTGRLEPPTSADFGHLGGIELRSLVSNLREGKNVQALQFALQVLGELQASKVEAGTDEEGLSRIEFTAAYNNRIDEAAAAQNYSGKIPKLEKNGAVALIGQLCSAGLLKTQGSGKKTCYRVTAQGAEMAQQTEDQFAERWMASQEERQQNDVS